MDVIWSDKKRWTFFALPLTFTKYSCTKEKLLIESGCFSKKEEEIRLYRIIDMTLERSMFQRLFGVGTIKCDTVDRSTPVLLIKNVRDSRNVKELLSDAVEAERVRKRVTSREHMLADDFEDNDDEV
ncbi:MAG: PH domain-containing protein [Lachnospiraceae bacterium]|jgi:uncharacterized membrane protein YdbT with pleckstrin-like domain